MSVCIMSHEYSASSLYMQQLIAATCASSTIQEYLGGTIVSDHYLEGTYSELYAVVLFVSCIVEFESPWTVLESLGPME